MNFEELRKKTNVKFIVSNSRYFIAKLNEVPELSDSVFAIIKDTEEVTVVAKRGNETGVNVGGKVFQANHF